jgi:hypothetical protein
LTVIVDSAEFERTTVTVSAGLRPDGGAGKSIALVRPWFDTMRAPSDKSQDFYLPPRAGGKRHSDQAPITLTPGMDPKVEVSAHFLVAGGMCVMGTGTLTINVP